MVVTCGRFTVSKNVHVGTYLLLISSVLRSLDLSNNNMIIFYINIQILVGTKVLLT